MKPVDLSDIPPRERRQRCYVAQDDTEVGVRGESLAEVMWRGRQWAVTAYGLEALDGRYVVEASRLAEDCESDSKLWPMPEHIARKTWVDVDDLLTAWMVALTLHGVRLPAERVQAIVAGCPPRRVID